MWWAVLFAFFGVVMSLVFYFTDRIYGYAIALFATFICGTASAFLLDYTGAHKGLSIISFLVIFSIV